jgi:hypothetical protein
VIKRALVVLCFIMSLAGPAYGQNYQYGMNTQLNLNALSGPIADKMTELGAGVLRMPFGWDVIEPACKGCFDWTATDAWRDQARRTRRTIFATLGFTPRWANGGRALNYPPSNYQDWYDFVFAAVTRYKDDIFLWGIWNEPNLDAYVHDRDVQVYRTLVVTASAAIRAANPLARVLGPEVSHHALTDGWYAATMHAVGDAFDIVTVHWYPDGPDLAFMMDELVRPFAPRRTVWLTEAGLKPCGTMFGEAAQALFYQRVLNAFQPRRSWWTAVLFYDVYERPLPPDCGTAIVRPDWSNRPAFALLQAFIRANP